jgi:hypothetical protein
MASCDGGAISSAGMSYEWKIYRGTVLQAFTSSARDPSRLVLPSFSLQVSTVYKVEVTASMNGQSSSYAVQVAVQSGELVAVVEGGLEQSMRVSTLLVIDGVASYDEDHPSVTGVAAGLVYKWSCVQIAPILSSSCSGVFTNNGIDQQTGPSLELQAAADVANAKAQIVMTVSDPNTSRSASKTITVSILPSLAATMQLESNGRSNKINAGQSLQIVGTVVSPASLSAALQWTIDSSAGLNLSTIAMTSISTLLSAQADLSSSTVISSQFILKLAANSLMGGLSYRFTLGCQLASPGIATSASINIAVNLPPAPGTFQVTPGSGVELVDRFTFVCRQWFDVDLPLLYQFSYVSQSGNEIIVRTLAETTFTALSLPAGSETNENRVTTIANIYDSYMANSTVTGQVVVSEGLVVNTTAMQSYLESNLNVLSGGSTNVDEMKQAAGLTSYLLNLVNCSLAPNCSELNRSPCFVTAHTCGRCKSDEYIGSLGDGNDFCLPVTDVNPQTEFTPSDKMKECASGCSGHGTCIFVSLKQLDKVLETCYDKEFDCKAECLCDEGYGASPACDLSDEEASIKASYRESLVSNVAMMMSLENPSAESVGSWISSLSEVSQASGELNLAATSSMLMLVQNITSQSKDQNIDASQLSGLVDVLGAGLSAIDSVVQQERRRRMRARRLVTEDASLEDEEADNKRRLVEITAASLQQLQNSLNDYTSLLSNNMVVGQYPVVQVRDGVRVFAQAIKLSSTGSSSSMKSQVANDYVGAHPLSKVHMIGSSSSSSSCQSSSEVSIPQSGLEKVLGKQPSVISFPSCTGQSSGLNVGVSSYSSIATRELFDSNPLSLQLSSFPCSTAECTIELTLQRNKPTSLVYPLPSTANASRSEFEFQCRSGELRNHSFDCPDGFRYTVNCTGKQQTVQVECPKVLTKNPTCDLVFGQAGGSPVCKMVRFTDETVTCSCSLAASAILAGSNQQTAVDPATGLPSGKVTLNYVSMLQGVTGQFQSTVLSAASLDANQIKSGWQAMLVIGTLIGGFLISMISAHYADAQTKRVATEEAQAHNPFSQMLRTSFYGENQRKSKLLPKLNLAARPGTSPTSAMLELAEESLPDILGSKSVITTIKNEVKRHHRWIAVVFFYSDKFPRVLRVMSLATSLVVMLFIQSLTYNLTNGDNGSCERLEDVTACLEPRSSFATGTSKCYWTPEANGSGSSNEGICQFVQPDNDLQVVIFVAIFSALMSTPISLLADWVIMRVLAAPTISRFFLKSSNLKYSISQRPNDDSNDLVVVPSGSESRKVILADTVKSNEIVAKARSEFVELCRVLKVYRANLNESSQLFEFDGKFSP